LRGEDVPSVISKERQRLSSSTGSLTVTPPVPEPVEGLTRKTEEVSKWHTVKFWIYSSLRND